MVDLRGKAVVLRALEREHCRHLWKADEPTEPLPSQPLTPGLSVEGADRWFDDMQSKQGKEQFYLGIFSLKGRLLGDIQIANIDWRNRTATLGYGISRSTDRAKGYATDAVLVLLRFAFADLDLYRITVETADHNTASRRVLEKCGFVQEGCSRQATYCGGKRHDRIIYGLLRPEFVESRQPARLASPPGGLRRPRKSS
jgi:RimJ/RimL family protein N-acetyltransferase